VSRNPSGPAPELSHKPAARGPHVLGERSQHRPVQWQVVKLTPDEACVAGSDAVICLRQRGPA
jgi:hypothetical protein